MRRREIARLKKLAKLKFISDERKRLIATGLSKADVHYRLQGKFLLNPKRLSSRNEKELYRKNGKTFTKSLKAKSNLGHSWKRLDRTTVLRIRTRNIISDNIENYSIDNDFLHEY